jgi:hypothetical protein
MDPEDLLNRFTFHAPTGGKARAHEKVRLECHSAAIEIDHLGPDCREKSLAITALEEAMMWGNAMIARHPEPK